MIRHRLIRAALLLTPSAFLAGCADSTSPPPPPTTGTIGIAVTTTGVDVDPDGYLLSVDGQAPQPVPANGSASWTGGGGAHTIAISGLAFNCDVTTPVASATVTLGETTHIAIAASCTPFLRGAIIYGSEAFGFNEVMVMRPDGSRPTRLTTDQVVYANPAVSPDGQSIVVNTYLGGSWSGLYLLDRFGKSRQKIVDWPAGTAGGAAWSPDGARLVFTGLVKGPNGDYGRIFVVNRDGSGIHPLMPEPVGYAFDMAPAWSPDGTRIYFSRAAETSDLWVANIDGTGAAPLGLKTNTAQQPAVSPDGRQIAFMAYVNNATTIMIADASGANVRALTTPPPSGDQFPQWSPDGRRILFSRVENGALQLYVMMADGTGVTKLSSVPQSEGPGRWSPAF